MRSRAGAALSLGERLTLEGKKLAPRASLDPTAQSSLPPDRYPELAGAYPALDPMRSQRALLVLLAAILILVGGAFVLLLRAPANSTRDEPAREAEPAPPKPRPSEDTQSTDANARADGAGAKPAPPADEPLLPPPGKPVKVVGAITDERGEPLEDVQVLVYDDFGEWHKPELLVRGRYECTLYRRGRTLVTAEGPERCRVEVPFELMEADEQRTIDLALAPREEIGVHLRDLADKPLPRFARGQPLRAPLRAVATIEELPPALPAHCAAGLHADTQREHLGWSSFTREGLEQLLAKAAQRLVEARSNRPGEAPPRQETRRRRKDGLPRPAVREWILQRFSPYVQNSLEQQDEELFDEALSHARTAYEHREPDPSVPDELSADRAFLAALGYVDERGQPIRGESRLRDRIGTLALARPLPLRVSLLAGDVVVASQELVPGTRDVTFRVDFEKLATRYVHAWIFVRDSKTGARIPGVRANLHVDPLPGGPLDAEHPDGGYSGRAWPAGEVVPHWRAAPAGWRYPDRESISTDNGRADFIAATPGWWRLTLDDAQHVPLAKWVCVPDQPEADLGMFELAPLADSLLHVQDEHGEAVRARFEVVPLLHAAERAGVLESWSFESDDAGELRLARVGLQALLLRGDDRIWTIEPTVLDNGAAHVKEAVLPARRARHVLVHLPAKLPWNSVVNIVTSLNQPVYQERFGGQTIVDLWVPDGLYTLQVIEEPTELLTTKFAVSKRPMLVELVR